MKKENCFRVIVKLTFCQMLLVDHSDTIKLGTLMQCFLVSLFHSRIDCCKWNIPFGCIFVSVLLCRISHNFYMSVNKISMNKMTDYVIWKVYENRQILWWKNCLLEVIWNCKAKFIDFLYTLQVNFILILIIPCVIITVSNINQQMPVPTILQIVYL
jgi:hypothetical protein